MRVLKLTTTGKALDRDGVAQAQTPLAAGNLTLNGALVSGGIADMGIVSTVTRNLAAAVTTKGSTYVSIYAGGNESGRTFTVTGTLFLENGDSIAQSVDVT